ncbi:MAG: SLC13 family permease [Tistlia sp.]|uniref:SLC13 family permease n=1 Tax=Tistlia sp. TaxID=3057121 RepID=UPI0034A29518
MNTEQILLFAILGAALLLFAWGRLRYDLVAMIALLAAVVVGVVPGERAFEGFGHPAVITVAAILILTRSLRNSALVDMAARLLGSLGARPTVQVLGLAGVTAIFSAFMNNVGALALMLPVALAVAGEARRPASEVLMPISFASLLGGLTTLIGTPPNIVIASFRAQETGEPFGMFDFAPVGLSVALVGVVFVALVGWRLLPQRQEQGSTAVKPLVAIEDYVTEVRLPSNSAYVGRRLIDIETLAQADVQVVALVRNDDRILAPSGFIRLQAGDILIIEADSDALQLVLAKAELQLVGAADISAADLRSERVGLVEAVIVPGSRLEGRTAHSMHLHTRFGLNLLAVARQGEEQHERLGQVRFTAGDVLLLQGEREALPDVLAALGCLPLAGRDLQLRRRGGSIWSPLIFLLAIGTVVAGLLPPQIAFMIAALCTLAVGDVHLRELYESVEWPVIILLGALIPVGMALETTGGSGIIALPLLHLGDQAPAWVVLGMLMIVTMLLSDIMNNAATAVLMAPIGVTVAHGLGANVDPFLMAVAIGASSTYLTPIGHQSNLLVMGPGGYRFYDYWRMGLPLDLLILLVGLPMILLFWPL